MTEPCPSCGRVPYVGGGIEHAPDCGDDIELDIAHLRYADGTCRVSVNGQGHFPCDEHPKIDPPTESPSGKQSYVALPPLVLKNCDCMTTCQCPPVCCNKPMHGNPAPKDWVCRECGSVAGAS